MQQNRLGELAQQQQQQHNRSARAGNLEQHKPWQQHWASWSGELSCPAVATKLSTTQLSWDGEATAGPSTRVPCLLYTCCCVAAAAAIAGPTSRSWPTFRRWIHWLSWRVAAAAKQLVNFPFSLQGGFLLRLCIPPYSPFYLVEMADESSYCQSLFPWLYFFP